MKLCGMRERSWYEAPHCVALHAGYLLKKYLYELYFEQSIYAASAPYRVAPLIFFSSFIYLACSNSGNSKISLLVPQITECGKSIVINPITRSNIASCRISLNIGVIYGKAIS